jgi:hypothetical protein
MIAPAGFSSMYTSGRSVQMIWCAVKYAMPTRFGHSVGTRPGMLPPTPPSRTILSGEQRDMVWPLLDAQTNLLLGTKTRKRKRKRKRKS